MMVKSLIDRPKRFVASITLFWLLLFFYSQPSFADESFKLSPTEQAWLDQHKEIRFAGDPHWLPYEAFDSQGKYIGIVAEHLTLVEEKLGIVFKPVETKTWGQSVAKIKVFESPCRDSPIH